MLSESKKHVLITGGTSGLGLGLAKKYFEAGNKVCVTSLESIEEAKTILPEGIEYFQADVTNPAAMREVISEFTISSGKLDLVIANAGINHKKAKIPDFVQASKVIDVNVKGTLNTFAPAIEIMKEQGSGQLVGISSISGVIGGLPGMSVYGASKAAIFSMCQSLELDLREYGIRVTTLAPGFIDTPLTENNDHPMPFLMKAEDAVEKMYQAIEQKKDLYMFPLPLKLITQLMTYSPRPLYKTLMRANLLKLGKNN